MVVVIGVGLVGSRRIYLLIPIRCTGIPGSLVW